MSKVITFKKLVGRWGLRKAIYRTILSLVRPWLTLCEIHVRRNHSLDDAATVIQDIEVRLASRDELMEASKEQPKIIGRTSIESSLLNGDICVAAFVGSKIVSYHWAAFTTQKWNDRLSIEFDESCRYAYRSYTRPEYRGRRIMQSLRRFCDNECLRRGFTRTVACVDSGNYSSLAGLRRAGSHRVGYVGYLKLFGKYYPFRTSGAKAYSVRLYDHQDRRFFHHSRADV